MSTQDFKTVCKKNKSRIAEVTNRLAEVRQIIQHMCAYCTNDDHVALSLQKQSCAGH